MFYLYLSMIYVSVTWGWLVYLYFLSQEMQEATNKVFMSFIICELFDICLLYCTPENLSIPKRKNTVRGKYFLLTIDGSWQWSWKHFLYICFRCKCTHLPYILRGATCKREIMCMIQEHFFLLLNKSTHSAVQVIARSCGDNFWMIFFILPHYCFMWLLVRITQNISSYMDFRKIIIKLFHYS